MAKLTKKQKRAKAKKQRGSNKAQNQRRRNQDMHIAAARMARSLGPSLVLNMLLTDLKESYS